MAEFVGHGAQQIQTEDTPDMNGAVDNHTFSTDLSNVGASFIR
jgi:hypothetical protein